MIVWGGIKTINSVIKKAVFLAQLSFVRGSLGQGSCLRCLFQVTLLCQHHLSFDFWSMLFQFHAIVTLPFSLAGKLRVFQLLWNFFRLNSFSMNFWLHDLSSHFKKTQIWDCIVTLAELWPTPAAAMPAQPEPCLPLWLTSSGAKVAAKSGEGCDDTRELLLLQLALWYFCSKSALWPL